MYFFLFYFIPYIFIFFLNIYLTYRVIDNRKNKAIFILLSIPIIPSIFSLIILNTIFNNFIYATKIYFHAGDLKEFLSSTPVLFNVYKNMFKTSFLFLIKKENMYQFFLLIFSIVYFIYYAHKYTFKTTKSKKIFKIIYLICASFLAFPFYPIYQLIKYIKKETVFGTRRDLLRGCDVIRDPIEAEERFRLEFLSSKKDGLKFYKDVIIPFNIETKNFLFMGGMGAGKTYAFMMRLLHQFYERGHRTIVSDVKGDFCQVFGQDDGVKILGPFDSRSVAWDISADIATEMEALEFVSYLIPIKNAQSSMAYFQQAARDLIAGAIMSLQAEKPKQWSFADIFAVIADKRRLVTAIKDYRPGALEHIQDSGFDEAGNFVPSKLTVGILADIRAHFQNLETLVKAWPNSCGGFSIKKFARGEDNSTKMVIVQFVNRYQTLSAFFSAMVFEMFFKEVDSLPESYFERFGVFLDELGVLPRIPAFVQATKQLRSKGGAMFVCFQEFGVVNSEYKEDGGTEAIVNAFGTKVAGIAQTPEYAEYFVKTFGQNTYKKTTRTKTVDAKGLISVSTTREQVVEDAVATGELLNIPELDLQAVMFVKMHGIPLVFRLNMPIQIEVKKYPAWIEPDWVRAIPKKVSQSVTEVSEDRSGASVENKPPSSSSNKQVKMEKEDGLEKIEPQKKNQEKNKRLAQRREEMEKEMEHDPFA
jgi:hypothetical protein